MVQSLALDEAPRPWRARHSGQTKLFKQHLHQRLTFASYSGDNDAYRALGISWWLWSSIRTRRPHVSRLRTVLRTSAWSLSFPRGFALQLGDIPGTWRSHRNLPCGLSLQVPQGPHQQRHQFQTRIWTRNWSHSCTSNLTPSPQRPGSHLWNFARAWPIPRMTDLVLFDSNYARQRPCFGICCCRNFVV